MFLIILEFIYLNSIFLVFSYFLFDGDLHDDAPEGPLQGVAHNRGGLAPHALQTLHQQRPPSPHILLPHIPPPRKPAPQLPHV